MVRSAALAVLLGLAGSAVAAADEPATELAWGDCPADVVTKVATLQCTTVSVPLDYAEPDGERIDLMVSRLASRHPEKRRAC